MESNTFNIFKAVARRRSGKKERLRTNGN